MIQIKKTILTLVALLLTAVTGAWAEEVTVTWEGSTLESIDVNSYGTTKTQTIGDITITANSGYFQTTTDSWTQSKATTASAFEANGLVFSSEKNIKSVEVHASDDSTFGGACIGGVTSHTYTLTPAATSFAFPYGDGWVKITKIVFTLEEAATSGPKVDWKKTTKTGTFKMPGGNVTLEPEYYPQAALTAVPTAINDVPATTDGAIVKAGTVENIGETETAQGTVMYYVSQTALDNAALLALAADAWTADVPTAKSLAQGQAYVYYYVRGNDSNNDAENFSDGDILAANALTVTIAAEPTYAVTFAEGVNPEPPAEPEWTADPNAGVKKGQTVTVTYSGERKVMGVKAEKKAKAPSLNITSPVVGQIIGSDGKNYAANATLPTGVTPVAKICYVSGSNGLALALTDEGYMDWSTAKTTCAAHTPAFTGGTWKLASNDEWDNMISAAGSYSALRDGFSSVGGTNMLSAGYWSSTESNAEGASFYFFDYGYWSEAYKDSEGNAVRACLAF